MLDVIFPKSIEEEVNFRDLLEIDFHWICRCLRILNYGPYFTTNNIYCYACGQISSGEYQVDLRSVEVKTLPDGFSNTITISKDEFLDFDSDIILHLPTIQEMMNAAKDPLFVDRNGDTDARFARLCYMIKGIGNNTKMSVPEIKMTLQNKMTPADYMILKSLANEKVSYGLRLGGRTVCPKCGNKNAGFAAYVDDRFFRPTMGDLRAWKADRNAKKSDRPDTADGKSGGRVENLSGNAPAKV